jgi:hypothetical protein
LSDTNPHVILVGHPPVTELLGGGVTVLHQLS